MHGLVRAIILMAFLLSARSAFAGGGSCPANSPVAGNNTCYFIAANGADTNSGTSESNPWLHAPGMPNCSNACAAVQSAWGSMGTEAGYGLIFRGGDTWHEGNSSPTDGMPYTGNQTNSCTPNAGNTCANFDVRWSGGGASTCQYEGTTTGCFYVGVDKTWYNAAVCGTSWCRPKLNGDNPLSTSVVASCQYQSGANNILFSLSPFSLSTYVYFDSFELLGLCMQDTTPPSTHDVVIQDTGTGTTGNGMDILNNIYLHGWTASTAVFNNTATPCISLSGGNQNLWSIIGMVMDGSDSTPGACAPEFPGIYHMKDSIWRYTSGGAGSWCHDIHDNIFEHIQPGIGNSNWDGNGSWNTTHNNVWECNQDNPGGAVGQPSGTSNVFYNNILRHDNPGMAGVGPVHWWFCPTTVPEYWFNNLIYDTVGGQQWDYAGPPVYPYCANSGGQFMFNNTFVDTPTHPCYVPNVTQGGQYLTVYNEHMINSFFDSGSTSCAGQNDASNVLMSSATAKSQGYVTGSKGSSGATNTCANEVTTPCSPTAATNGTVGTGRNEQTYCASLAGYTQEYAIGTEAANACRFSTTDGCTYVVNTHTMSCPGQIAVARPATTAWTSGAYQFSGQGPQAPTNLQATVEPTQ